MTQYMEYLTKECTFRLSGTNQKPYLSQGATFLLDVVRESISLNMLLQG